MKRLIKKSATEEEIRKKLENTKVLYHGTSLGTIDNILIEGFKDGSFTAFDYEGAVHYAFDRTFDRIVSFIEMARYGNSYHSYQDKEAYAYPIVLHVDPRGYLEKIDDISVVLDQGPGNQIYFNQSINFLEPKYVLKYDHLLNRKWINYLKANLPKVYNLEEHEVKKYLDEYFDYWGIGN